MSLKSKLGFMYRAIVGIKDNIFDNPKINFEINSFSIGKTLLGNNINCYKFGNSGEKILYFGGIHGNEVGTVKLMNRWTNHLGNNKNLYKNKQVFIVPCLNIDGYKKALKNSDYFSGGVIGKINGNNVDLNRNFPTLNWSSKTKLFAAGKYSEVSGGTEAGSEPEIKSLLDLISRENIKIVYTFHNCWSTVFSLNTNNKAEEYSKKSGYRIYKKEEWDKLIPEQKTGHSVIWGEENNIELIEIEMKTRYGSEWNKNREALVNSLNLK